MKALATWADADSVGCLQRRSEEGAAAHPDLHRRRPRRYQPADLLPDLIHFDLPWNSPRLEHRNGRIDRKLQVKNETEAERLARARRKWMTKLWIASSNAVRQRRAVVFGYGFNRP